MKIALVNTILSTQSDAGAEGVVRLFAAELVRQGHDIILVTSSENEVPGLDGQHVALGTSNIYSPYPERRHSPLAKAVFHAIDGYNPLSRRLIRRSGALDDVQAIFTHNIRGISPSVWYAQCGNQKSVNVHYLHDYQLLCTSATMFRKNTTCHRQCGICRIATSPRRLASSRVQLVYGASSYILDRHLEAGYFRGARASVLEPPFNAATFRGRTVRSGRRFGFLGRITPEKGLHRLLNAFEADYRQGRRRLGEATLAIAGRGEGEYFDEMMQRVSALPGVNYMGFMKAEHFFEEIDTLVVPSLWPDPNPLVVIEAYTHGVPVVAAKVGGLMTSVVDGETGWHFVHDEHDSDITAKLREATRIQAMSYDAMAKKVAERDIRVNVERIITDIDRALASL